MVALSLLVFMAAADEPPKPRVPLGKETTIVDGPLDKEGYVDFPAALNAKLGQGVTPQTNANALLWQVFGPNPEGGKGLPDEFFKTLGIPRPPEDGDYFQDYEKYFKQHVVPPPMGEEWTPIHEMMAQATRQPWSAKDQPHLAAWLTANEKPLALVVEASKRPHYFNPLVPFATDNGPGMLIGSLLPHVQKSRALGAALLYRAQLGIGEGRFDDAWQDLIAVHRLARHIGRGATLIEGLVGIALELIATRADLSYLQHAPLTAAQLQARWKELEALPPLVNMADKIDLGERFIFLDTVQNLARGNGGGMVDGGIGGNWKLVNLGILMKTANPWYDRMATALRLQDRAKRTLELKAIEHDAKVMNQKLHDGIVLNTLWAMMDEKLMAKQMGERLIGLMLPAALKVQEAADRSEQGLQTHRIAFALAASHHDTQVFPAKLDDLVPKYLVTVPGDNYSQKPLMYQRTETGYKLYSVGLNGKDDEGRNADDTPKGDDLVVVMPPAAPKKP